METAARRRTCRCDSARFQAGSGSDPVHRGGIEASQRQGKRILVQITASWSPVCVRQRRIVGLLQEEPRFKDLMVYTIDFDARKDLVREMGAQEQIR